MRSPNQLNYPDILGMLTGGQRYSISVVDVALTVRPRVVRAGRPFEVIMLIQNNSDAPVDVHVALQMPEKDAAGQKDKFVTSKQNLVIGMQPAEVGYVTLPMSSMPDTAISRDYVVGMEVSATPLQKPARVRKNDAGDEGDITLLAEDKRESALELQKLRYSINKRGLRTTILEVGFSLLAGKVGKPLHLEPGWTTLWTLDDQNDEELLLQLYRVLLRDDVIPKLRRRALHQPLLEKVKEKFEGAGYKLLAIEADAIARLLVLILEFANLSRTSHEKMDAGIYNLEPRLADKRLMVDETLPLPRWTVALLRALARDPRVEKVAARAIPFVAFDELLYDAMIYSFYRIEYITGEDLGTDEEKADYAEMMLKKLSMKGEMDFSQAYMPLVIGGILAFERIMLQDERLDETLEGLKYVLENRQDEMDESNELIFEMTQNVINTTLKKYGALDNR